MEDFSSKKVKRVSDLINRLSAEDLKRITEFMIYKDPDLVVNMAKGYIKASGALDDAPPPDASDEYPEYDLVVSIPDDDKDSKHGRIKFRRDPGGSGRIFVYADSKNCQWKCVGEVAEVRDPDDPTQNRDFFKYRGEYGSHNSCGAVCGHRSGVYRLYTLARVIYRELENMRDLPDRIEYKG